MEISQDSQFHLAQSLIPHSAAVRSLATGGIFAITGSIDKTCKIYKKVDGQYHLVNEVNIFNDYIFALQVKQAQDGFIVGCKDKHIYVLDLEGNPVQELEGHEGPVNSLSESPSGKLISGAWDGTAIVWDMATGTPVHKLEGHSHAVAVLALDHEVFITGSQDANIHVWEGNKKVKTITKAHQDIIRELARVGEIGFVSCSNDESIKMWSISGELISTFVGHQAFIFTVSLLGDGRILSGSDDRSLKIWRNENCEQSISHPGTIWVARADQDGDIITACSDGLTRVFSTNPSRKANADELNDFERSTEMAASSGPEGLSEAELAKLPSTNDMGKVKGKKDGEIRIFKNGTTPEAFMWKEAEGKWEKIGDVIGNKTTKWYDGDKYFPQGEYDYVFDVDDESGVPKLLPFNDGDNPMVSAEKFLAREGLNKGYLEQVTSFIRKNTRHSTGQPKKTAQKKALQSKYIPYTQVILFETGNFDGLSKKIFEFDAELKDTQYVLKENDKNRLIRIISVLKDVGNYHMHEFSDLEVEVISKNLIKWPLDKLLPVLDLFRLFLLHHASEKLFSRLDAGLQYLTWICQIIRSSPSDVYLALCLKILANMFKHTSNKNNIMKYKDMLLEAFTSQNIPKNPKDTVRVALAAFIFNISTAVSDFNFNQKEIEQYFDFIGECLSCEGNQDSVLKYFMAIGNTLLRNDMAGKAGDAVGLRGYIENSHAESEAAKECKGDLLNYLS